MSTILGVAVGQTQGRKPHMDGAACLVHNDTVVALPEERVTRVKCLGGFRHSLRTLLSTQQIAGHDIDVVAISTCGESSLGPESRIFVDPKSELTLSDIGVRNASLMYCPSHHLAHAWHAATQCRSSRALVSVFDYEGSDCEVNSHFLFSGQDLSLLHRDVLDKGNGGVGAAYHAAAIAIGMDPWRDAGKFCGLASHGRPNGGADCVFTGASPSIRTRLSSDTRSALPSLAGLSPKRQPADFAATIQRQAENAVLACLERIIGNHDVGEVIVSGGVANNCGLIGAITRRFSRHAVGSCFAPGDSGQAIGNVIWALHSLKLQIPRAIQSPFLGPGITRLEEDLIRKSLSVTHQEIRFEFEERAADWVSAGGILATFLGRAEFGPRALGARSFLIRSDRRELACHLNEVVKGREEYRPFGVILGHAAGGRVSPSPFMDRVVQWNDIADGFESLAGCRSGDGSIRYQTLRPDSPDALVRIVEQLATDGITAINTSLNGPGEPTALTAHDLLTLVGRHPYVAVVLAGAFYRPKAGRIWQT